MRDTRGDAQTRARDRTGLLDGDFGGQGAGFSIEQKYAAINMAVPAIEDVFGAAP